MLVSSAALSARVERPLVGRLSGPASAGRNSVEAEDTLKSPIGWNLQQQLGEYSFVVCYWNDAGNVTDPDVGWAADIGTHITGQSGDSTCSYTVPYSYSLDSVDGLKTAILATLAWRKLINHH